MDALDGLTMLVPREGVGGSPKEDSAFEGPVAKGGEVNAGGDPNWLSGDEVVSWVSKALPEPP